MKIDIIIRGVQRIVEVTHPGDRPRWQIDAQVIEADAVQVSPGIYSILIDGESIDVRVEGNRSALRVVVDGREYLASIENRRELKRNRAGAAEVAGRQSVMAPMAGKVIAALVKVGDEVQSGQGLLIVEAMKMQNEIRSPKAGQVERVAVVKGQKVNSGDVVIVIA
jgi:biotin carboxyl carrier protein